MALVIKLDKHCINGNRLYVAVWRVPLLKLHLGLDVALKGKFEGVREQVDEDLAEPLPV